MVLPKLRAVAFVKDEDDAFIAQLFQPLLVVALVAAIQGKAELLNGGNDHLVGIIIGEQPMNKGFSIGVLFDAPLLKLVELLPRLPVEVFAVYHKEAFVDIRVILEQRGCLEGGECFAAAGGVPDVAVAAVLVNALDDSLDSIYLVRTHHHQLLLAGHQHHVAADHFAKGAFGEELFGEAVEMGDLLVVLPGKLVERQKTLVGVEAEVVAVVVGKVPGIGAVADDEELHKAEQCFAVTIAGVVFVFDNLLHGPARAYSQRFQLYLYHRHAVDEEQHIVAVMAVIGVDAKLVDYLKAVFAPLFDVDQGVMQRCAIVALEAVALAQMASSGEDVRGDDLIQQAGKLCIRQMHSIERLKLFAEVLLQCVPVADVRAIAVLEILQFVDQALFNLLFCCHAYILNALPKLLP